MSLLRNDARTLYITAANCPTKLRGGAFRQCGASAAQVQIQAAVDALRATLQGGTVYLSPGSYAISAPIKLYQGIHLVGAGMYTSQVSLTANSKCDMVQHFAAYDYTGTATAGGATSLTDAGAAWTVDALIGKYIYIWGGLGAGQRRLITDNDATSVTVAAWGVNPDNTSLYRIGATQQLFMGIEGMTLNGNIANNAATTGAATSASATTLTLTGAGWTVNKWADKATIEITSGAGINQVRRIVSNTADTVTIDGPWVTTPGAGDTFSIGGSCIAMYGPSAYDLMLTDVWADAGTHYGVYCEETWGHVYKNLISEYNGFDGFRAALAPFQRGTTGTWNTSSGVVPTIGPKMTLCKLVQNLRHGIYLGEYVYNSLVQDCEIAGGGAGGYGLVCESTALENVIVGNRIVSSAGTSTGGMLIQSAGNVIADNIIKSGAGAAGLTYGLRITSGYNAVNGNLIGLSGSGTPISDTDGRNAYAGNQVMTIQQRLRVRGKKSLVKGAGDYVTLNPQLGTAPAACVITPLILPADAQTRNAGKWNVAGYPVPTASAVIVECDTALTAATTSAEEVTAAGAATITLTAGAGYAVGGYARFAAGGAGSTEEDVLITAVAGNDITATFDYRHDSGVAVTPLWTFAYDVGYNDRGTVAA